MLQKLCFILVLAMLLGGCGASAPMQEDSAVLPETVSQNGACSSPAETVAEQPDQEPCQVEYFTFHKTSNTVRDEENRAILLENGVAASFVSDDAQRREWVAGVLSERDRIYAVTSSNLLDYAREFISMEGMDYFYAYSNYRQFGVARHDDAVVSLVELSSIYSGGTHPNSVQMAWNLDINNSRILRLEDVIAPDAAQELEGMVRSVIEERFAGIGLFDDYSESIRSSMVYGAMTPYWYLNDRGLVIFYNQYELAPYAAGIIKVELPYDALDGILLEEFRQIPGGDDGGDLIVRSEGQGLHAIPITMEPEGAHLTVGVDGTVYQVQLSEITWLEDTPVAQDLIFSAKTLCENDVLEITGGFDDENRSFALSFLNGRGEQKIYYLHPGELTPEH